jgi:hypothetical protein
MPTLFRRAAALSAFGASALHAGIGKSEAHNNNVVRKLNEQFKVGCFPVTKRFLRWTNSAFQRQLRVLDAPRSLHDYSAGISLTRASLSANAYPMRIRMNLGSALTI